MRTEYPVRTTKSLANSLFSNEALTLCRKNMIYTRIEITLRIANDLRSNGTHGRILVPFIRILAWTACLCLGTISTSRAQFDRSIISANKEKVRYEFTETDFVNGLLRPETKREIFVGQPFVVQIWLINHTRHPLTIKTNFIPKSRLNVTVRRRGYSPRIINGPYENGFYADDNHRVYPMQEVSHDLILWGDKNSPNGLVFPEPGNYIVDINQDIHMVEAALEGNLVLGQFELEVLETPEALRPVVSQLINHDGFNRLMLQRVDIEFANILRKLLGESYPKSRLTPHMSFALGNHLAGLWTKIKNTSRFTPEHKKKLIDQGLIQLQIAALSNFPLRDDADLALMTLFDSLQQAHLASGFAKKYVEHSPRSMIGIVGNHKIVQQYLINTAELDLVKDWLLLE